MAEAKRIVRADEALAIEESPVRRNLVPAVAPQPLELSIIIVTWNSERWIDRCLDSIETACDGMTHEVVIFDNASTDGTADVLTARGARVIRSQENIGFAAGINRAWSESRGRYMFLLNPDCELTPRALTELVGFLESHPEVAAVAPLLADESGDSQREFQFRRFPTFRSLASEILLLDELFPNNRATAKYRYRDLDLTHPQPVEQPAAAALLLRREIVDEVGPLDESFSPAWFEDVDYCRRIAAQGKSVWVVPAARARHVGGASLAAMSFERFTDVWYRNMWRYTRKWLPAVDAEALRWVIIVGMLLRCVAAVAGFAHPEVGRWNAFRAYANVLRKAFRRWDESLSS